MDRVYFIRKGQARHFYRRDLSRLRMETGAMLGISLRSPVGRFAGFVGKCSI